MLTSKVTQREQKPEMSTGHGTKPTAVVKEKRVPVSEIFGPTIQGEGITAGQRTIFIRFGLCDYKCVKCDSMHAVDPRYVKEHATWMTQEAILMDVLERCKQSNCASITFSGGNPCIHDLSGLVQGLNAAKITISVETQGTFMPAWLYSCDYITVSPKGPGMGEIFEPTKFQRFLTHYGYRPSFCTKVVIFSAQDLEFAGVIAQMCQEEATDIMEEGRFYLSLGNPYPPVFDQESNEYVGEPMVRDDGLSIQERLIESFNQILDDLKGYPQLMRARFLPQIHVLIYGNERGR